MRLLSALLSSFLLLELLSPDAAYAQASKKRPVAAEDEEEEEEEPEKAPAEKTQLQDVVRGGWVMGDAGTLDYLGKLSLGESYYPFGYGVSWGNSFRLSGGYDVLTADRLGMALRFAYTQSLNRAVDSTYAGAEGFLTYGHFQSHLLEVSVQPGYYLGPAGRLHVFGRLGAGMTFLQAHRPASEIAEPLRVLYTSLDNGFNPKITASLGGGVEYYTRLAHFSFMLLEANFYYVMGVDLAASVNFMGLKYTF